MKTLGNHLVLYDAACPMCKLYTSAFVKTGMLDANGRQAYQQMPELLCPLVDPRRAVDEIALVNTATGTVTYGIHSLFLILGNAFPICRPLFACQPFAWCMSKCYAFISYNRRVIAPPACNESTVAMQPSFRIGYRIAYLLLGWLITAAILSSYSPLLTGIVPRGFTGREYLVCAGQLVFQACVVRRWAKYQLWQYLGNMTTVSLGGALLLLPVVLLAPVMGKASLGYAIYFLFVVLLMLLEHSRRCRLLALGWLPTITWVLYRLVILFIFFY